MQTFFWNWQLAALGDLDSLLWFVASALGDVLDLLDDIVSLQNLTEDNMFSIEPAIEG
jgi:hypothetical protein